MKEFEKVSLEGDVSVDYQKTYSISKGQRAISLANYDLKESKNEINHTYLLLSKLCLM